MGKFSRNREYTFASLEDMITDIIETFDEGQDINIVLSCEEVPKYLISLFATGRFQPYDITWAKPEIDGYAAEYCISLCHFSDENSIFVEQEYNTKYERYVDGDPNVTDIAFISIDVSTSLYDKYITDGFNTVLFDVKE